jgi:hypothetical protein
MFISNKYLNHYTKLMDKAKTRVFLKRKTGYQQHHVLPKSLGGDDSFDNLRWLTYREHFVAHLLLMKITSGKDRSKMAFALMRFGGRNKTGRSFSHAAYLISQANSGQNNPMFGKPLTEDHRNKISGKNHGMFGRSCKDVWIAKYGQEKADELEKQMLQKRSKSLSGKNNPMFGKPRTAEQKINQSKKLSGVNHFNFGKSAFNAGKVWVNNGLESKMFAVDNIPAGWSRGRLKKIN